MGKNTGTAPFLVIAHDIECPFGPCCRDIEKIGRATGPCSGSGTCAAPGTQHKDHGLSFLALKGVNRANTAFSAVFTGLAMRLVLPVWWCRLWCGMKDRF